MSTTRVGRRLRAQILADADGRCGYCRVSEEITRALLVRARAYWIAAGWHPPEERGAVL